MADEKSPARISHRRFATSCSEMRIIATCRIFYDTAKSIYIFGRIAVLKPYRGTGLGSLLLTEAQSYVTAKNAAKIGISAQVRAAGFYETLGFVRQGEEYLEENCPHIYMEKTL